jgi:hypothetical protein
MTSTPDIRTSDAKGRLTLPREFASSTLLLEVVNENELVIRKAAVTPLSESGHPGSLRLTLSPAAFDHFLSVLDNPPEPNAALRKLMSGSPTIKAKPARKPRK